MPLREIRDPSGALRWQIQNPARKNAVDPEALAFVAGRAPTLDGEIVIVEGAPPGPFCAGFDLTHLEVPEDEHVPDAPLVAATSAMMDADATFVGAVQGYAIGAGVEILSCCDLAVAELGAWFRVPVATVGVLYHRAGLHRIRRTFGSALARRLILLGERVTAEEALAAGALTHLTPPGEIGATLDRLVKDLRSTAPPVLAGHRRLFRAARDGQPDPVEAYDAARAALYRRRRGS